MKRFFVVLAMVLFLVVAISALIYIDLNTERKTITNNAVSTNIEPMNVELTVENLAQVLSEQKMVKEMPKNGAIMLKLFDIENREWVVKKAYIITRGKVVEGSVNDADMTITINSAYLNDIGKDLCAAVRKANDNFDLDFDSKMTTTALLWKYKSMLKYRDCFGF